MNRWFRWYRGTSENPKFRLAARNGGVTLVTVMAVWQVLLEDAASEDHRGVCHKKEDFIAAALDLADDGSVEAALRGLEYCGLISVGIGAITINRWKEWQYEQDVSDPTNADRQRRFREKKRSEHADKTPRNGRVTAHNAPDTETDTETDEGRRAKARALIPLKRVFPADGSVVYTDWVASIIRKHQPGRDVDLVASQFRRWCHEKDIDFADPTIEKVLTTFCQKHRIAA